MFELLTIPCLKCIVLVLELPVTDIFPTIRILTPTIEYHGPISCIKTFKTKNIRLKNVLCLNKDIFLILL